VDSTVGGAVYETQTVHEYEDYTTGEIQTTVDLEGLEGLDEGVIIQLINQVSWEIQRWGEKVFGKVRNEEMVEHYVRKGSGEQDASGYEALDMSGKDEALKEILEKLRNNGTLDREEEELFREYAAVRDGELGAHIGYGPEFTENPDLGKGKRDNVKYEGAGELGQILLDFQWNEMKMNVGFAELAKPAYDKKLWEPGVIPWLEPPAARQIVDTGVQVYASVVGTILNAVPGVGPMLSMAVSVAINMSDDIVFGGADLIGGYKEIGEVGVELGKKTAISVVNAGIGAATAGAGSAFGTAAAGANAGLNTVVKTGVSGAIADNFGTVIGQTMLAGAQTYVTGTATNAIEAIEWRDGNIGWNRDIFDQGMNGLEANTLSAMAGSLVTGSLGLVNMFDGNHIQLSDYVFNTANLQKFNGLMGGLTEAGVTYGMTGEAVFNVINAGMFTGNMSNTGLLELHVGENGINTRIGSAGVDISAGTITSSIGGLVETAKIGSAKLDAIIGENRGLSTLNAINMLGYTEDGFNTDLARKIWNGKIKATYGALGYEDGNRIIGKYDENNAGQIMLSEDLLGMGKEEAAKLATVMAHEGTHAAGIRYEAIAHMQGYNTYSKLEEVFGLQGDTAFQGAIIQAFMNPASYRENTGNVDLWTLTENGGLKVDGSGYLRDKDGKYINKDGNGSDTLDPEKAVGAPGMETGLLKILDMEDTSIARGLVQNIMLSGGLSYYVKPGDTDAPANWYWDTPTNNDKVIGNKYLALLGMIHLPEDMVSENARDAADIISLLANQEATNQDWQKKADGTTFCNYVYSSIVSKVYENNNTVLKNLEDKKIIGAQANLLGENSAKYLERLYAPWLAQAYANAGYLVSMSYINPGEHGHIAIVTPPLWHLYSGLGALCHSRWFS
jgi:hypothetical protein